MTIKPTPRSNIPYTIGSEMPHLEDPTYWPPGWHPGLGGDVSVLTMVKPKIIMTTPTIRRETPRPRAGIQAITQDRGLVDSPI
ncbi:hypothetical protein E6H35_07465 [Candidatus Bathyarchaeota archaeon]|nr:MAG: hypothetical protein E6H35_07465 [Candidatus Bathyarchaeota archaeon]